jgi:hypothetical protein
MKTLLIALLLVSSLSAFPVRFKWNKNPANEEIKEYRLYQVVNGVRVLKHTHVATAGAETFERSIPVEVDSGQVWVVTAFNELESEPSDPKVIPVKPTKPGTLELEIVLESTEKGIEWIPIAQAIVETDAPTTLFRTRITNITQK